MGDGSVVMDRARARWAAALGLAILLVAGAGCERREPAVRVVVITLDTLREDAFTGGPETPSAMPRLLARAERGARFSRFYASTSTTDPSHATMFTALHPWEHGVTSNGDVLDERIVTVTEALCEAGFETRAVVASYPVAARFGFGQGFDEFHEDFTTGFDGLRRWEGHPAPARFFSVAETVTMHALRSLDGATARKQFFWFHYFDPHAPYGSSRGLKHAKWDVLRRIAAGEAEASVLDDVHRLYRADVEYLDRSLDTLLARLEADSDRFETHIVIVSDHGESLGEGGSLAHGNRLTAVEIRVPALILSPRVTPGVRQDVAGSIDVAPTLLAMAGLEPWGLGGRDLSRPGSGSADAVGMRRTFRRPAPTELRLDGKEHVLPNLLFYAVDSSGRIRRGNAHGMLDASDDGDQDLLARFRAFETQLAGRETPGVLDPEVERGLRELGYVP
jgi:arylsulfatase A-like enzyme